MARARRTLAVALVHALCAREAGARLAVICTATSPHHPNVVTFFFAGALPASYNRSAVPAQFDAHPAATLHMQLQNGETISAPFVGACDAGGVPANSANAKLRRSLSAALPLGDASLACGGRRVPAPDAGSADLGPLFTHRHTLTCYGETVASVTLPTAGYAPFGAPLPPGAPQNCAFSSWGGSAHELSVWRYASVFGLRPGAHAFWVTGLDGTELAPAGDGCFGVACGGAALDFTLNPAPNWSPCNIGLRAGEAEPQRALLPVSVADGGEACGAAPAVAGATVASRVACAGAFSGQNCPLACAGGLLASGQNLCENGQWRGGFRCDALGACALPTAPASQVGELNGLPLTGISGAACSPLTPVGVACRIACNASAGVWGAGTVQCAPRVAADASLGGRWTPQVDNGLPPECFAELDRERPSLDALPHVAHAEPPNVTSIGDNVASRPDVGARLVFAPPREYVGNYGYSIITRYEMRVTPPDTLRCPTLRESPPPADGIVCAGALANVEYTVEDVDFVLAGDASSFDERLFEEKLARLLTVAREHVFVTGVRAGSTVVTARLFSPRTADRSAQQLAKALTDLGPAGLSFRLDFAFAVQAVALAGASVPSPPPRGGGGGGGGSGGGGGGDDDDDEDSVVDGPVVVRPGGVGFDFSSLPAFYTSGGVIALLCTSLCCACAVGVGCWRAWRLNQAEETFDVDEEDEDEDEEDGEARADEAGDAMLKNLGRTTAAAHNDDDDDDDGRAHGGVGGAGYQLPLPSLWSQRTPREPALPARSCLRTAARAERQSLVDASRGRKVAVRWGEVDDSPRAMAAAPRGASGARGALSILPPPPPPAAFAAVVPPLGPAAGWMGGAGADERPERPSFDGLSTCRTERSSASPLRDAPRVERGSGWALTPRGQADAQGGGAGGCAPFLDSARAATALAEPRGSIEGGAAAVESPSSGASSPLSTARSLASARAVRGGDGGDDAGAARAGASTPRFTLEPVWPQLRGRGGGADADGAHAASSTLAARRAVAAAAAAAADDETGRRGGDTDDTGGGGDDALYAPNWAALTHREAPRPPGPAASGTLAPAQMRRPKKGPGGIDRPGCPSPAPSQPGSRRASLPGADAAAGAAAAAPPREQPAPGEPPARGAAGPRPGVAALRPRDAEGCTPRASDTEP